VYGITSPLRTGIYVCLLVLASNLVFTTTQKAYAQPADITTSVSGARNVGGARLSVWGFQVYDARLWTEPEFTAETYLQRSFALEIIYLRNVSSDDIAESSLKEMRGIGDMTDTQAQTWLAQMRKLFPDIKKGDRLVGIYKPGFGALFTLNSKPAGEVRDIEFARLFFGIWLSPQTSRPQMRLQLLGQTTSGAAGMRSNTP
jgi:Chalcone isomerase-like